MWHILLDRMSPIADFRVSQCSVLVGRYANLPHILALWMHLLMKDIPFVENPGPQEERGWTRTAFYLRWRESKSQPTDIDQGNASSPTTSEDENTNVTLVCFGAVKHFRQRCMEMRTSKSWANILKDPYTLVGYFLESWYERVDRIVWSANQRGSKLETVSLSADMPNRTANDDIANSARNICSKSLKPEVGTETGGSIPSSTSCYLATRRTRGFLESN
jgi:hypothetical protein